MKPPNKYKLLRDFTPHDHFRHLRGERVISDEYAEYRADALAAAGLESEDAVESGTKPLEEWDADDHLRDIESKRP